jgi:deoxyhypusine synthase
MKRIRDEHEKSERNEATREAAHAHGVHDGGMLERDR